MSSASSATLRREASQDHTSISRRRIVVALLLVLIALLAYRHVGDCGFLNLDDDAYVEHQPLVNRGLRSAAVAWAFTAPHSGTWHPLTTLSHALDCSLFGVRAAPMHWENVVFHASNAALIFWAWSALFGGIWRPAFVAAVFALHPLNVESVGWISERKNVLSTMFWLLGLLAYVRYVQRPSWTRYAWVAVALGLGLLSKPMLVTFPFVLLLLDFWPLARARLGWVTLLKEKLPLMGLSMATSLITLAAQAHDGATDYGKRFSLLARFDNAVVSYTRYLEKFVWPKSLSAFYWMPSAWPWTIFGGSLVLLAILTFLSVRQRHARPWLLFGWLWFLGTLVPVIGIVQSGAQAMADRYAYIPLLGISTALVWTGAEIASRRGHALHFLWAGALTALGACFVLTQHQLKAWRDSVTLYRHSIAIGEDNPAVRVLLASALQASGHPKSEVVKQYHAALALRADYVNALTMLLVLEFNDGHHDQARTLLDQSLKYEPRNPFLHHNLGSFAVWNGQTEAAVRHYEDELRLNPRAADAHWEIGQIRLRQNRLPEALAHYEARAQIDRWNPEAQCDYAILLGNVGRHNDSVRFLQRALWLLPDHARARQALDRLRSIAPPAR